MEVLLACYEASFQSIQNGDAGYVLATMDDLND